MVEKKIIILQKRGGRNCPQKSGGSEAPPLPPPMCWLKAYSTSNPTSFRINIRKFVPQDNYCLILLERYSAGNT